jgi:hypothetical protein
MRTSCNWLLIPLFTEFSTLGLLTLLGYQEAVDWAIIRTMRRSFDAAQWILNNFNPGMLRSVFEVEMTRLRRYIHAKGDYLE